MPNTNERDESQKFSEMLAHQTKRKKRSQSLVEFKRDKFGNRVYKGNPRCLQKRKKTTGGASKDDLDLEPGAFEVDDNSHEHVAEFQELQESVEKSLEFLTSSGKTRKKQKNWGQRQRENDEIWKKNRDAIFNCFLSKENLDNSCFICHAPKAIISCDECNKAFCNVCDVLVHKSQVLHNRKSFPQGYAMPSSPCEYYDEHMEIQTGVRLVPLVVSKCICCDTFTYDFEYIPSTELCVVVSVKGRYNLNKFTCRCKDCGSNFNPFNTETLIGNQYWPASFKNPSYIVEENVFQTWDFFQKRMPGSSEKAFLESLNDMTSYYGRHGKIYQQPFGTLYREWKYCNFQAQELKKINFFECPCCNVAQHSCHIDGNCKLYRYASSGRRRRKSLYGELFIVEDEKIETYLNNIYGSRGSYKKKESDNVCGGSWTAAKNVGKKKGSLDDTGLEVATCRHTIAQKALNMKQGELYGYPLYLMKNFMTVWEVEFCWSDVMCKLWKFVEKMEPELVGKMKPALSVMHAKGHSLQCQVQWDGQWLNGTGRSTGEESEQFFSYISRCSNTTKYQLPERREETITEHAMHWNRLKVIQLASFLAKKYKKIKIELDGFQTELKDLSVLYNISNDEEHLMSLVHNIKSFASQKPAIKFTSLDMKQQFVLVCLEAKLLRSPILELVPESVLQSLSDIYIDNIEGLTLVSANTKAKESILRRYIPGLEDNLAEVGNHLIQEVILPIVHKEIEKAFFEKTYWLVVLKKCGDKSKRRHIIRLKVEKSSKKLNSLLIPLESITKKLDDHIKTGIKNGNFPWSEFQSLSASSASEERLLADVYMRTKRAKEELVLIKRDMTSYLSYYRNKIDELRAAITIWKDIDDCKREALSQCGLGFAEEQLAKGVQFFSAVITTNQNYGQNELEERKSESDCESEKEIEGENDDDILTKHVDIEDEWDKDLLHFTGESIAPNLKIADCFKFNLPDGKKLILPEQYAQGNINGRNGSSACTVIAILAGYAVYQMTNINLRNIVIGFIGATEIGNIIYEENHLDGLLNVYNALTALPASLKLECVEEMSTIFEEKMEVPVNENSFYVLISNEKTFSFVMKEEIIFFMDSHVNAPHGSAIYEFPNERCFNKFIQHTFSQSYINIAAIRIL